MDASLPNSLAQKAKPFIRQIEAIERDMDSATGAHMANMKRIRERRKDVYTAAKDAGVPVRPLKGYVKQCRLQRKIDAISDGFDIDEQAAYLELAHGALGELGEAAAKAAGYRADDDEDVRPRFKQAAADEALAKVGRGREKKVDPIEVINNRG